MFLPCTIEEIKALKWERPDIILISGDAYIDSPYCGTALIGQHLSRNGFKIAVISQPVKPEDFTALGEPSLFWGISAGCVDSMVANYTASGKRRHSDDFTPGGENNRRPDRAVIAYANQLRAAFKPCKPIVIGGIEASLRRVAHYDFWSNKVRRSILADAKADILSYGMGERSMLKLAHAFAAGAPWKNIRGICYLSSKSEDIPPNALYLPAFSELSQPDEKGKLKFVEAHRIFSTNQEPVNARTIVQKTDARWLIHNPPALPLEPDELDKVHDINWMLDAPPSIAAMGKIRALDTIRFAVTTHRGCYGNCNFCAIAIHQGRRVVSRSEESILAEIKRFARHRGFRGVISDVGGPTANMYGFDCKTKERTGACRDKRCLFPTVCPLLKPDHRRQLELLAKIRRLPGVKRVFVASGIRPDLTVADEKHGNCYIDTIAAHHVSGQLKLAPEHVVAKVLDAMGKPSNDALLRFKARFDAASRKAGKKQFLTYYFIAAHPGCTASDMKQLKTFAREKLHLNPEQVQIFTPTPMTASTVMYYTGINPDTGETVFCETGLKGKNRQKEMLYPNHANRGELRNAWSSGAKFKTKRR